MVAGIIGWRQVRRCGCVAVPSQPRGKDLLGLLSALRRGGRLVSWH